jgi:membrane protein YdbS with pleckstrin-like domain
MQQPKSEPMGEHVVREARISWWALWPRSALGLAAAALAVWGLLRQDSVGYGIATAGALGFAWFFGGALVRRMAMKASLTDRCVIVESGIASRRTSTVMLNRVESIDIDQTLWQRMAGYGTVTIHGTGSEDLKIVGMHDPLGFQADARSAINVASESGRTDSQPA